MKKWLSSTFVLLLGAVLYSCNNSDYIQNMPKGYIFIYEGGNQNRILRNNLSVIDSGVVDCKFNSNFIVFAVDTTYSMDPLNVPKENLQYYIHNVSRDSLSEPLNLNSFRKMLNLLDDDDLDLSKD